MYLPDPARRAPRRGRGLRPTGHHVGADWHELAAAAGIDHDDTRQRYAIPADNTREAFLPQEPDA